MKNNSDDYDIFLLNEYKLDEIFFYGGKTPRVVF